MDYNQQIKIRQSLINSLILSLVVFVFLFVNLTIFLRLYLYIPHLIQHSPKLILLFSYLGFEVEDFIPKFPLLILAFVNFRILCLYFVSYSTFFLNIIKFTFQIYSIYIRNLCCIFVVSTSKSRYYFELIIRQWSSSTFKLCFAIY